MFDASDATLGVYTISQRSIHFLLPDPFLLFVQHLLHGLLPPPTHTPSEWRQERSAVDTPVEVIDLHYFSAIGLARFVFLQLAVLSGLFRIHPLLRQRHCTDWPEYHWSEVCKHMRLEEVRSLDKVGANQYLLTFVGLILPR